MYSLIWKLFVIHYSFFTKNGTVIFFLSNFRYYA